MPQRLVHATLVVDCHIAQPISRMPSIHGHEGDAVLHQVFQWPRLNLRSQQSHAVHLANEHPPDRLLHPPRVKVGGSHQHLLTAFDDDSLKTLNELRKEWICTVLTNHAIRAAPAVFQGRRTVIGKELYLLDYLANALDCFRSYQT